MSVVNEFDLTTKKGCKKVIQRAQKEISRGSKKVKGLQGLVRDAQWCLELMRRRGRRNLLWEEDIHWR